MPKLDRDEYVEQAYLFKMLNERLRSADPLQELLLHAKQEILATVQLPMAVDFLLAELNHTGTMSSAMLRLPHYFTAFQSYIVSEAESERGRFDIRTAVKILHGEARYRAGQPTPEGVFFYQFESLCRNRLRYDHGLAAIAEDPIFEPAWRQWILRVRKQIGMVDIADLVYVASQHYVDQQNRLDHDQMEAPDAILFGPKEGKIALANRHQEPLFFFNALQRHLNYPPVPRPERRSESADVIPQLVRQMERLESRIKLLEDEQRESGIDLSRFYHRPDQPPADSND